MEYDEVEFDLFFEVLKHDFLHAIPSRIYSNLKGYDLSRDSAGRTLLFLMNNRVDPSLVNFFYCRVVLIKYTDYDIELYLKKFINENFYDCFFGVDREAIIDYNEIEKFYLPISCDTHDVGGGGVTEEEPCPYDGKPEIHYDFPESITDYEEGVWIGDDPILFRAFAYDLPNSNNRREVTINSDDTNVEQGFDPYEWELSPKEGNQKSITLIISATNCNGTKEIPIFRCIIRHGEVVPGNDDPWWNPRDMPAPGDNNIFFHRKVQYCNFDDPGGQAGSFKSWSYPTLYVCDEERRDETDEASTQWQIAICGETWHSLTEYKLRGWIDYEYMSKTYNDAPYVDDEFGVDITFLHNDTISCANRGIYFLRRVHTYEDGYQSYMRKLIGNGVLQGRLIPLQRNKFNPDLWEYEPLNEAFESMIGSYDSITEFVEWQGNQCPFFTIFNIREIGIVYKFAALACASSEYEHNKCPMWTETLNGYPLNNATTSGFRFRWDKYTKVSLYKSYQGVTGNYEPVPIGIEISYEGGFYYQYHVELDAYDMWFRLDVELGCGVVYSTFYGTRFTRELFQPVEAPSDTCILFDMGVTREYNDTLTDVTDQYPLFNVNGSITNTDYTGQCIVPTEPLIFTPQELPLPYPPYIPTPIEYTPLIIYKYFPEDTGTIYHDVCSRVLRLNENTGVIDVLLPTDILSITYESVELWNGTYFSDSYFDSPGKYECIITLSDNSIGLLVVEKRNDAIKSSELIRLQDPEITTTTFYNELEYVFSTFVEGLKPLYNTTWIDGTYLGTENVINRPSFRYQMSLEVYSDKLYNGTGLEYTNWAATGHNLLIGMKTATPASRGTPAVTYSADGCLYFYIPYYIDPLWNNEALKLPHFTFFIDGIHNLGEIQPGLETFSVTDYPNSVARTRTYDIFDNYTPGDLIGYQGYHFKTEIGLPNNLVTGWNFIPVKLNSDCFDKDLTTILFGKVHTSLPWGYEYNLMNAKSISKDVYLKKLRLTCCVAEIDNYQCLHKTQFNTDGGHYLSICDAYPAENEQYFGHDARYNTILRGNKLGNYIQHQKGLGVQWFGSATENVDLNEYEHQGRLVTPSTCNTFYVRPNHLNWLQLSLHATRDTASDDYTQYDVWFQKHSLGLGLLIPKKNVGVPP